MELNIKVAAYLPYTDKISFAYTSKKFLDTPDYGAEYIESLVTEANSYGLALGTGDITTVLLFLGLSNRDREAVASALEDVVSRGKFVYGDPPAAGDGCPSDLYYDVRTHRYNSATASRITCSGAQQKVFSTINGKRSICASSRYFTQQSIKVLHTLLP